MANLIKFSPKNKFIQSVLALAGGTIGAQIIMLFATPFLTRLYSPTEFGFFAIYGSILAIFGIISCLRYELAIPLPIKDAPAVNLVVICVFIVTLISAITAFIILVQSQLISEFLGLEEVEYLFWALPVGIFFTGIYNVFTYWNIRKKKFGRIATTKLSQVVVALLIQFSAFKLGSIALVSGYLTGQAVSAITLVKSFKPALLAKYISWNSIKLTAIRYKQFPLVSIWSGLINTLGSQLPTLVFATYFSVSAVGLFALANRFLAIPTALIGQSLGQVFLAHGAESSRSGDLRRIFLEIQDILIRLGMPPALIVVLVAPALFGIVFGSTWIQSGQIVQYLMLGTFFNFLVSPLAQVFNILEAQSLNLKLQIVLSALKISGISLGIMQDDFMLATLYFSLGSAAGYFIYFFFCCKLVGLSILVSIKAMINGAIASLLCCTPIIFSMNLEYDGLIVLVGSLVASLLIYFIFFQQRMAKISL